MRQLIKYIQFFYQQLFYIYVLWLILRNYLHDFCINLVFKTNILGIILDAQDV